MRGLLASQPGHQGYRVQPGHRGQRQAVARVTAMIIVAALGVNPGCGDDDEATPPAQTAKPTAAAAAAAGSKIQLAEKVHIEDRVSCSVPDRPSDPKDGKCDLKAPSCGEHLYCMQLAQGSYCEPCPERDGIRHAFRERDFTEQNRDPFQSFLLPQFVTGRTGDTVPLDPTKKCLRKDQMVASGYSYADLKLVGIVAQGTQRKVLMMGGPLGYIIKRGDCVGKEKAVVKDIGAGFITFQVDPDTAIASARSTEEYSVQLNPKQLIVDEPDLVMPAPRTSITPVVPPPATLPARPGQPAAAAPTAPVAPTPAGQAVPAAGSAGAAPPVVAPPVEAAPVAPVPKRSFVPAESASKRQ